MEYLKEEIRDGEIFIGNITTDQPFKEWQKQFKTLRRGSIALDIYGKKLHKDHCAPLFIHKSELDLYDKAWGNQLNIYSND